LLQYTEPWTLHGAASRRLDEHLAPGRAGGWWRGSAGRSCAAELPGGRRRAGLGPSR